MQERDRTSREKLMGVLADVLLPRGKLKGAEVFSGVGLLVVGASRSDNTGAVIVLTGAGLMLHGGGILGNFILPAGVHEPVGELIELKVNSEDPTLAEVRVRNRYTGRIVSWTGEIKGAIDNEGKFVVNPGDYVQLFDTGAKRIIPQAVMVSLKERASKG